MMTREKGVKGSRKTRLFLFCYSIKLRYLFIMKDTVLEAVARKAKVEMAFANNLTV
ncbi:TATA-binding protein-associated factor 172 [Oceanobacillus picturae]|uniref:TATA-binding protein-associated factor 172 n=1 Tax=Oceanobacillus picturae TaxID=171693 RepID=A0A0U9H2F5_9BACI|nr:hypothetical protein [Oceanobacillus picturae]GAQ16794.1 TATA-binding protein-associated factor 172 [Oceanobacillus picturae]